MLKWCIAVCSVIILSINVANGQSLALPADGHTNTFGTALSSGVFLDKEAVFWGFALDYSKVIFQNWIVNFSVAYDQEHTNTKGNEQSIVNTLTPALAVGYAFNKKIAMVIAFN